MKQENKTKHVSDLLLILWAGGAALLSYSLVYALRKPYTAAAFDGLTFLGSDYKVAVTTIQILGYVISKFFGIKLISELKREKRFRFFVASAVMAEAALVGFGLLPVPYNVIAMFVNGLSLGCMWGVIFSFIEGRKVTDILASLLGVSMVFSSGFAKSFGLFALFIFFRSNIKAIMGLMALVLAGCLTLTYVSFNYNTLNLRPVTWLFIISLSLYIAYLTFQTIFFDRFIACFRIKGNVGFFIALIDFIGYIGTVTLLSTKESLDIKTDWFALFNHMACFVGAACTVLFSVAAVLIYRRYMHGRQGRKSREEADVYMNLQYNTI